MLVGMQTLIFIDQCITNDTQYFETIDPSSQ